MPLGNVTQMKEEERALIRKWIRQGKPMEARPVNTQYPRDLFGYGHEPPTPNGPAMHASQFNLS